MNKFVKNSIHTVNIDGYDSNGNGIARIDGRVVFVRRAIAGEICDIRILKSGKTAAWAKIERIIEPSPHRTEPACSIFGKCGGCDLQHMDYFEELRYKKQRVEDALSRIGGINVAVEEIIGADKPERYRNKAIYTVSGVSGAPVIGFFRERSHDVVPAEHCQIQTEASERAAAAVRRWMEKNRVPAYDEKTGSGCVRRIFCRTASSGKLQVVLVTAAEELPACGALISELLSACPETVGITQNINKTRDNTVLAGPFRTIWGSDTLNDTLCGLTFSLSPRSFYQVNHTQAGILYGKVLEFAGLTGRETVLDLYCGTGTITLFLARYAGRAIGAEIIEDAVRDARENARRNNIENAEFICADATRAAKQLKDSGLNPDVIVVDPPRKGLAPEVISEVAGMSPDRIVYVSCDPATLARDLRLFGELEYRTTRVVAVDMFPRTSHVECIIMITNSGLGSK